MKKREFNKYFNSCCDRVKGKKILNEQKLDALPNDIKHSLALYIIKEEGMIHPMLMTNLMN